MRERSNTKAVTPPSGPVLVRWVVTLDGEPLAFPSVSAIVAGKTAKVSEAEAAAAVASGLAEVVTTTSPAVDPAAKE